MKFQPQDLLLRQQGRSPSGFTLIELLVATSITAILVVVLAAMANQAMRTNEKVVGDAMRNTDAEFVLETVLADLEALAFSPKDKGQVLVYEPELIHGVTFGKLMLLSATTDGDPLNYSGAPRAVSYRIAYQNPIDGGSTNPVYSVYRAVADAEVTALHATGLSNLEKEFWESNSRAPNRTEVRHFLAANILDFNVRFRVRRIERKGVVGAWEWTEKGDTVRITTEGAEVLRPNYDEDDIEALKGVRWEVSAAEVRLTVITPSDRTLSKARNLPIDEVKKRFGRAHLRRTAVFASGWPDPWADLERGTDQK